MAKKILVVDDEPDIVEMITIRLKANGYDVVSARNGKEGFKKAKEEHPDLVILDILMPEVDGVTMSANMKKDPELKDIPVVFLTCIVDKSEIKNKSHSIAGDIFMAKPFDARELMVTIDKLLKK